uniref:Uncharacterized protein n=1 Tax=Arundo donax TaxID=35708 RepID=A0A0A9B4Q1_ARUDO
MQSQKWLSCCVVS